MKSDIVVIGGGASGLMAAYSAALTSATLFEKESASDPSAQPRSVTLLERMPRPARKIMISGKGRCNFTNFKEWNDFSSHVKAGQKLLKNAFYNLPPTKLIELLESYGLKSVIERGDRAFPESHHASDVVDSLVLACQSKGVKIETETEVSSITPLPDGGFEINSSDGRNWKCAKLIVATGGLSYPTTGSNGDGLIWARQYGHTLTPIFPSLTALVPAGYKLDAESTEYPADFDPYSLAQGKSLHIDRSSPLSELGESLCGVSLKNISVRLMVEGNVADEEFGDIDFTDGGIEGPIGFALSRKAVKSLVGGSRVALSLDLKPGVSLTELTTRVHELWTEVDKDPRSVRLREKEKCRIMLGKLMPWDLIPGFVKCNPQIMTLERKSRTETKLWINLTSIAKALKDWKFDIAGFVGYERCVVTAGGVSADSVVPKTLESRVCPGMYFCGEILDIDADTGGYNLQSAFSTGYLAGENAAKSLF